MGMTRTTGVWSNYKYLWLAVLVTVLSWNTASPREPAPIVKLGKYMFYLRD